MDEQIDLNIEIKVKVKEAPEIGEQMTGCILDHPLLKKGSLFITSEITRVDTGFVQGEGGATFVDGVAETIYNKIYFIVDPHFTLPDVYSTESIEQEAFAAVEEQLKQQISMFVKTEPVVGTPMLGVVIKHPHHPAYTVIISSPVLKYEDNVAETKSSQYSLIIDPKLDFSAYGYAGPSEPISKEESIEIGTERAKKEFLTELRDLLQKHNVSFQGQSSGRYITVFYGDDLLLSSPDVDAETLTEELKARERKDKPRTY